VDWGESLAGWQPLAIVGAEAWLVAPSADAADLAIKQAIVDWRGPQQQAA